MSWGEDEREEQYYRYCYSCGDGWKMSNSEPTRGLPSIKIPGGTSDELPRGFKKGNFIICSWCDQLFKKSELRQLVKTKTKSQILEIRIERQKKYWKKKRK